MRRTRIRPNMTHGYWTFCERGCGSLNAHPVELNEAVDLADTHDLECPAHVPAVTHCTIHPEGSQWNVFCWQAECGWLSKHPVSIDDAAAIADSHDANHVHHQPAAVA